MNRVTYIINKYISNGRKMDPRVTPDFATYKKERVPEVRTGDGLLVR
jgi:hypothetical protein